MSTLTAERTYPYRFGWPLLLFCLVLFGAGCPLLWRKAATNQRGLIINGLIELGPDGATTFYGVFAALGAAIFVMFALMAWHNLTAPPLVLSTDSITIPALFKGPAAIPYASISDLAMINWSREVVLQIVHADGKTNIVASMLPKGAFAEVVQVVTDRWEMCRPQAK